MMTLLFCLSLVALQEPQVYFGFGLFLVATIVHSIYTENRKHLDITLQ